MPTARLLLICCVTATWAVSFGIGTQATSHWLKLHEASDTLIGLVHAAYYFGVAGASMAVPRLTRRLGLVTSSLGLFISALCLIAFPLVSGATAWLLVRALSGAGCALSLIPLETYLSRASAAERRSETFSYYAVALTLAGAAGISLGLEMFNAEGALVSIFGQAQHAFFVGAAFPLLGSLLAHIGLVRCEWDHGSRERPRPLCWKKHFLSFGTAWGQGFLEGGMLAFLSLFLVSRGLSTSAAGVLMGVTMVGVIAFQVPVAWIADRYGRLPTLLVCYAVTIAGLGATPYCTSVIWLGVWLFAFGACSGAMYPLGLSLLSDNLPASSLARAFAMYMAMECVGSQMGAGAMGWARDHWGGAAMFAVAAAGLVLVLGAWTIVRLTARHEAAGLIEEERRAA